MLDEYLNDDLPVCMEADSGCWDRSIYLKERPDKDYETDNDLPTPKPTNLKEAIQSLDDIQHFLESRGYIEEALKIGSAVDILTALKFKSSQQTTLYDYILYIMSNVDSSIATIILIIILAYLLYLSHII